MHSLRFLNVPVAFAASGSSLISGKKPVTILNAKENTINDNVQNGTKKQRIFPNMDTNKGHTQDKCLREFLNKKGAT